MDSTEIAAKLKERRDLYLHIAADQQEIIDEATAERDNAKRLAQEDDWMLEQIDAPAIEATNDPRLDPEPQRAKKGDVQALVVHLAMRDGGATAEEIIGGIARKRSQVNAAINGAMKKGKIVFRDGKYQVPESGASLPLESAAE